MSYLLRVTIKVLLRIVNINYLRVKLYDLDISLLSKKGVQVGDKSIIINCVFSSSSKGDKIIIGNNCTCTGVTFLAHDASPALFIAELNNQELHPCLAFSRRSYRSPIRLGDNVFVGYNSTILPGVSICNNVVIAAGSVVTKSIFEDGVYGGNPAKYLMPISEFVDKYKQKLNTEPDKF